MGIKDELPLLMTKADAIYARLDQLSRRISDLQNGPNIIRQIALVDPERCLGCGICADQCPQGAIVLGPYQAAAGSTQISHRNVATT